MPRPVWTGAIAFGLVHIPVQLHTAVRERRPHFRMLHAKDRSPINVARICQKEGRAVDWDDLVKGYEYEKGHFVVLSKEDFAAAALEKTRRIDVIDFVKTGDIDDRFYDKPYYLTAGKGGDTSYALLREAIRECDRIGIAKFIFHDVQHLAAVEAMGDVLILSTLRFANEIVDVGSLSFPSRKQIRKPELDLAKTLIENLAADWKPEKYKDDYRDNLMRLIKAKLKGKSPQLVSDEPHRESNVVDLMERLRRSLEASPRTLKAGDRVKVDRKASQPKKRRSRGKAA